MKLGSLVECVNNEGLKICKTPKLKTVYQIRGFNRLGAIWLEELKNIICPFAGDEWGYLPIRFRELQPPIANIEEHVNQNTLEPVLI